MNEEIISIVGKLIAAVLVGIMAYITPKLKDWLETNTSKSSQETIKLLITSFVKAAEQLLHDDDPTGEKRMDYVKDQLTALGVKLTAEVIGMIEGAVWEVNNQNKKIISEEKVNT